MFQEACAAIVDQVSMTRAHLVDKHTPATAEGWITFATDVGRCRPASSPHRHRDLAPHAHEATQSVLDECLQWLQWTSMSVPWEDIRSMDENAIAAALVFAREGMSLAEAILAGSLV